MTTPVDTEGVSGNAGAAPLGTGRFASNVDTATPGGVGGGDTGLAPDPNTAMSGTPDTSGAGQGQSATFTPVSTLLSGTLDTQSMGWPLTAGVSQAYRAPNTTIGTINGATGALDTTRTDTPISDGSTRPDLMSTYTGTMDSNYIGAPAVLPVSSLVPVAPAGTPTVSNAIAARSVRVTWATVADPHATAPVQGYVILGSTGGTTYAPRNATSVIVQNLVPGQSYKFQVAAQNINGLGPYGTVSAAVIPYNPDEADANDPNAGLEPANTQNPIYGPDGTIKAGTGLAGRPGAPTSVVLSGTTTPGVVNVVWVAPTGVGIVLRYTVTLSSGQTKTIAAGTLTAQFTGVASATAITGTVTAVGAVTSTTSAASAAFGKPTAPAAPTLTSPTAGTIHCVWTAPSSGAPLNYIITLAGGDTTTHTVAGNLLTYDFTSITTGHVDTATVGAQGSVSTTTSVASSAVTVS
jgi:hypothetical protein